MALRLVIGNKNYSSWSLRPWIAMKVAGIGFEETVIPLYEPGSRERILEVSPTGKVPVLIDDGDIRVWESLAIGEYLARQQSAIRLSIDGTRQGSDRPRTGPLHCRAQSEPAERDDRRRRRL